MGLTVNDLRKALKGVPGNTPVYTADHDHNKYEWNGIVRTAELIDQSDGCLEEIEDEFKITGPYFVIRP